MCQCCALLSKLEAAESHNAYTFVADFVYDRVNDRNNRKLTKKMFKFHCDINPEEDSQLLQAIQTILDAFSCKRLIIFRDFYCLKCYYVNVILAYKGKLKKTECERDHFKALLKSLQNSMR